MSYNRLVCLYLLLLLLSVVVSFAAAQPRNGPSPPTNDTQTQNFKPSMLVVIIVLITAFFFMGFFSIYLRQCVSENSTGIGGSIRRQTIGLRSRRVQKGLDSDLINTFPIFLYSEVKGLKIGKGTLECAVCLNEFEDDETLRLLPKCDHVFHPECIDAWLASHTTCPVCRCDLKEVSGEGTAEEAAVPVSEDVSSDDQEHIQSPPEISESQEQVLIRVNDRDEEDEEINNNKQSEISHPDVINPLQIPIQNRFRSKSTRPRIASKFPRSHSTGHSLVQPGDNVERFTLRLPEDVRKQMVADTQLNRAASYADLQTRQKSVSGSSGGSRLQGLRGGSLGGGAGHSGKYFHFGRLDRAAKSDHWGFKLTMPFFTRNPSVKSPKKSDGSVKSAFDNGVGAKSGGDGGSGTTNEQNQTNSTAAAPRPPV